MGGERQSNEFPTELPSTLEVAHAFDALVVNREKLSREEQIKALRVAQRSPQLLKALRRVEDRRRPPPSGDPLDRLHLIRIRSRLRNLVHSGVPTAPEAAARISVAEQYVTLGQGSALISRSKHTVRKWPGRPVPDVAGGGGKPHEWRWSRLRPWLEERSGKKLPQRFPRLRASAA